MNELIITWTSQRLQSMETEDEIRTNILELCPTANDFKNRKDEIYPLIFAGLPERDQQIFTASYNQAGVGGKRIRLQFMRKQEILFNELLQSLYKVEAEPVANSLRGIFQMVDDNEIMSHRVPPELMPILQPVVEQLTDKLSRMEVKDEATIVPSPVAVETTVVDEVLETPLCPICLDPLPVAKEEAIYCGNGHGIHVICRVDLARRCDHKCPLCRENIEPDGGRNFCSLFRINFDNPVARPRRIVAQQNPAQQVRRLRDRAIYLLQNRRHNNDVLTSVVNMLENTH